MRLPILVLASLLVAAPAFAQFGFGPSPREVARKVERAKNLPLGTAENPVRVGGPRGEHAYIARLRCGDGRRPRVGMRGNMGVGAFGNIVDMWPLDCGEAAPGQFGLYLDMYHPTHAETRAPAGFTLVPEGSPEEGDAVDKPAAAEPTT